MFCTYCGIKLDDDAVFCTNCGNKVVLDNNQSVNEKIVESISVNEKIPENNIEFAKADQNNSRTGYNTNPQITGKKNSKKAFFIFIPVIILLIISITIYIIFNSRSNNVLLSEISSSKNFSNSSESEVLDWYTDFGTIIATTYDSYTVRADIILGYKSSTKSDISSRIVEIKHVVRKYFEVSSGKELKSKKEAILENEICNIINDACMIETEIQNIKFTHFEVIQ